MNQYFQVKDYIANTRTMLQDMVGPPYRYSDDDIVDALNTTVAELSRIRPDIFLEYKYQSPLPRKAALDPMVPGLFVSTRPMETVPIPRPYYRPALWYVQGLLQMYDVDDTQDVRAQGFHQKFLGALMTVGA